MKSNKLEQTLQSAWMQRGLLACLLWPLSLVYGALSGLHRRLFRWGVLKTDVLAVPVVVVGNLVAGGGGKTPTVMAIVKHLKQQGLRPGIISRGYGRLDTRCQEVKPDSSPDLVGDEPALMQRTCQVPVFVATKRVDAAKALLAAYPDVNVIVSDDGLQHHALHHDLSITVFDDRAIGNGWLLPAGPLRQFVTKTSDDSDIILHTGQAPTLLQDVATTQFTARRSLANNAMRADGSQTVLSHLQNAMPAKPLLALAGIAKPEAFFSMLRQSGLTVFETLALPDHYSFNSELLNKYAGCDLICTEKDAVKLWQTRPDALAVPLVFEPEAAFFAAFDAALSPFLLNKKLSSRHGHQTT